MDTPPALPRRVPGKAWGERVDAAFDAHVLRSAAAVIRKHRRKPTFTTELMIHLLVRAAGHLEERL